jgi:hypothetical protein
MAETSFRLVLFDGSKARPSDYRGECSKPFGEAALPVRWPPDVIQRNRSVPAAGLLGSAAPNAH